MTPHHDVLNWIDAQAPPMRERVERWARINTGTFNLDGLAKLGEMVRRDFEPLGGAAQWVETDPLNDIDHDGRPVSRTLGRAIVIDKRPDAPRKALLVIHLDTVYPADSPFKDVSEPEPGNVRGPGVADAKGGLAVMLTALEALEQSPTASNLGWRVILNADEEIGSPGSRRLLTDSAREAHIGLVFEPTLPDGSLIGARKGAGNFTIVVRGRSAHVGREFDKGRSAVHALGPVITELAALNDTIPGAGATVNVGRITGGGALNKVADLAIARLNVRIADDDAGRTLLDAIQRIIGQHTRPGEIDIELHGGITSPPRPMDAPTTALFNHVADCGNRLGMKLSWQPSGGVCDGNKLAAAGLPTVDTLGPRGGKIHSDQEFLIIESLTERARLTALLLCRYAAGELNPPHRAEPT